jgi:ubiquinone/menaquinone biosynthesis C-methylase UbiE
MTTFSAPREHWNERFTKSDGFLFGTEPNGWLREHAGLWKPGQRVLCVADGEGRNSVWLAKQGLHVDAFDLSDVAVRRAHEFAESEGVHVNYAVANVAELEWPEAVYDGVAAIFIQFANPNLRARLFEGMVRCLKPGGTLVLQGYTPKQIEYGTGGPKVESHMYTEPLLREAFAGLEIVDLRDYEQELAEGAGHKGMSALIGLVARKPK